MLLQEYLFVPLDIFRKILHNKGIRNQLEAWLTFLSSDEPEIIEKLILAYPSFQAYYQEIYELCRDTERMMEMFSKELRELDQNTVQYMIDQMQEEMTGSMTCLIDVVAVSILSYLTANLLGVPPIYSSLLERILAKQPQAPEPEAGAEKVLDSFLVPVGSPVEGKRIREIPWHRNCLVASLIREGRTLTPKGDTVIEAGDELLVLIARDQYADDSTYIGRLIYGDSEE